jgi:hypothetical protein
VVPERRDNLGNKGFGTEFMAMGVPVVVADAMIDKYYFDSSTVTFFCSGDADDLARCRLEMIENPEDQCILFSTKRKLTASDPDHLACPETR